MFLRALYCVTASSWLPYLCLSSAAIFGLGYGYWRNVMVSLREHEEENGKAEARDFHGRRPCSVYLVYVAPCPRDSAQRCGRRSECGTVRSWQNVAGY